MLDSDNKILKWQAIHVIANLAVVDDDEVIDRRLPKYLKPISESVLITAANTINGSALIAAAKPKLAGRVATQILKVDQAEYQTPECRNIAIGHAIVALDSFFEHIRRKAPVIAFVQRQIDNPRSATQKKAEKFLSKRAGLSPAR